MRPPWETIKSHHNWIIKLRAETSTKIISRRQHKIIELPSERDWQSKQDYKAKRRWDKWASRYNHPTGSNNELFIQ